VTDPVQLREIKSVGWFDQRRVLERIREENAERIALFNGVHDTLSGREKAP
jgi:hypothetical protein